MGLLDKYNKDITTQVSPLIRNPNTPIEDPNSNPQQIDSFKQTSLDLENPNPLGGPINVAYNTQIGSEYKSFTTTQPYTPNSTYIDSLQSDELIRRASDPFK
tara:strand:- start:382 stop:687 length:306 start_codon:yes stop_codon:yes gene_type:complete